MDMEHEITQEDIIPDYCSTLRVDWVGVDSYHVSLNIVFLLAR